MFKRVQKLPEKLKKSQKRGEPIEDRGPPELVLDDDSDSDSSSSSASSSDSDSDSDDSSSVASVQQPNKKKASVAAAKVKKSNSAAAPVTKQNGRKRSHEETSSSEEESDSSSSSSSTAENDEEKGKKTAAKATDVRSAKRQKGGADSDSDSDSSEEDEDSDSSSQSSSIDDDSKSTGDSIDPALQPTVAKALENPIYTKPGAILKQGVPHRSCYICPPALLKTDKMVVTHLASGAHKRRLKRFNVELEKLTPKQRADPVDGGLDATAIAARAEKRAENRQESAKRHQEHIRLQRNESAYKRRAERKDRKLTLKKEKLQKKAMMKDLYVQQKEHPEMFERKIWLTPEGETLEELKKKKAKRLEKLHRVMPSKAERKAHRKVKKAERNHRKFLVREARRERIKEKEGGAAEPV